MRKITKKGATLLLAAGLCTTALAGCQSGVPRVSEEGKSQESAVSDTEEQMTLYLNSPWLEKLDASQPVYQELEKKFGVHLEMIPAQDKEALNLQIAGGDLPDYIRDQTFVDYHNYADQGIYAEVPVEMIKENAPRLSAWVEKNGGGEKAWSYFEHDGKNYSVPILWTLANHVNTLGWRSDMLEMAGFSEENPPITLDDMEKGMRKIHEEAGIAPLTGAGVESLSHVFGAYGVYMTYYEKDGEMVYGAIEPGAKEALVTLNRWYSDGLLDPEFMINTFDSVLEKWSSDQAGIFEYGWWDLLPKEAFFDGRLHECIKDRGLKNVIVMPPEGPGGESGFTQGNPFPSSGLQFTKALEDQPEKIAKYLQVFDYSFDRDMLDYLYYGVEGETYNYNEETGVEWIPPYDEEEMRNEYGINLYLLPGCFNDYDLQAKYYTQPQYLELRQEAEAKGIGEGPLLTPFYAPVYNEKSEILDKLESDAYIDFITGTRSLDEFDDFVSEWLAAGGQKVLDEQQQIYDENMK